MENQGTMAQRIGQADQSGRDLQIEQVARRLAAPDVAEADFLAPRMDNDLVMRIDDLIPEGLQGIQGKGIDKVERLGSGHLDEAKAGVIAFLADKFRVEAEALA